ncbi:MAG TPA: CHAP domain-containing protein [Minicystis sp.]|nr:CHAP domain-containing protein [Minicystis sp.]
MTQAARVGDAALSSGPDAPPVDPNSNGAAEASTVEARDGSPDVFVNGRAALRVDDGANGAWQASSGSRGVLINGRPAVRAGDATAHATDADGVVLDGSADVFFGDVRPGTPKERPHDRSLAIELTDALGRAIEDVVIDVFCPHQPAARQDAHGSATVSGLCTSSTVTVHKGLQAGTWDDNATQSVPAQATHDIGPAPPSSGGAAAPASSGTHTVVHAPAPGATAPAQQSTHLVRPSGSATVQLTTVHNWVELVYRAFGHDLPTGQLDLALLGVREASLAGAAKKVDTLEKEAGWGDVGEVDYTREHKAPAYNDLLFCAYTDKHVKTRQIVEVFECTVDASPGKHGHLHLPALVEGHLYHATPGPFHDKHYPGHDIALHVFRGEHPPKPSHEGTVAEVLKVAHGELGTTEHPPFSNRQKYGAWYGYNGAFWCAMFVSWVMAHAGKAEIHYMECNDGANHFRSGQWGTWHGGHDVRAEPGDVVFYQFHGAGNLDHTGIVVRDNGGSITTIEGNTSPQYSNGSNDNGGGVYLRTRPKDVLVGGFGRPHYAKHVEEDGPFIRWGGEAERVDLKYARGNTLLHHHYFHTDHHGRAHVDPHAERYRRFLHLYREAKNKKRIPYLIVSSRYVKSYAEWVSWLDANPGTKPTPRSILRAAGLEAPHGVAHRYVPSFLSKAYADRVLAHAHHMHDRHAAAAIRAELEGVLLHVHG